MTPRQMCGPAATAPEQSEKVAHCEVCHTQWQVQSLDEDPPRGCAFCDAPAKAITIEYERPDYSQGGTKNRR